MSNDRNEWFNQNHSFGRPMSFSLKYHNTEDWKKLQYHYIKFPFGLMDTSWLKDLLASYDHCTALKRTLGEKNGWTNNLGSHSQTRASQESNTASFLSSIWEGNCPSGTTDQITCGHKLVDTRCLSDVSVVYIANLINSKTSSALCLVTQHSTVMFTQDLLVKLERVRLEQDIVQDIFIIHNIGKEKMVITRITFDSGGSRGSLFGSFEPPFLPPIRPHLL